MTKTKELPRRHGDVVFFPLKGKVKGKLVEQKGSFILSKGSTTGHSHLLTSKGMEVRQFEQGYILSLKNKGLLTHEEHGAIELPKGEWYVGHEREKDHFSDAVKKVVD